MRTLLMLGSSLLAGAVQAAELHVAAGQERLIDEPRLQLERLVLEDGATLRLAPGLPRFELRAGRRGSAATCACWRAAAMRQQGERALPVARASPARMARPVSRARPVGPALPGPTCRSRSACAASVRCCWIPAAAPARLAAAGATAATGARRIAARECRWHRWSGRRGRCRRARWHGGAALLEPERGRLYPGQQPRPGRADPDRRWPGSRWRPWWQGRDCRAGEFSTRGQRHQGLSQWRRAGRGRPDRRAGEQRRDGTLPGAAAGAALTERRRRSAAQAISRSRRRPSMPIRLPTLSRSRSSFGASARRATTWVGWVRQAWA